jgi:peptide deformylase
MTQAPLTARHPERSYCLRTKEWLCYTGSYSGYDSKAPPTLYRSELLYGRKLVFRGLYVEALVEIAFYLAILLLVSYVVFFYANGNTFRASEPVKDVVKFEHTGLRKRLMRFLQDSPQTCGVAAPNERYYTRYLVVRLTLPNKESVLQEMYNPMFVGLDSTVSVREQSLLCPPDVAPRPVKRFTRINVTFTNHLLEPQNLIITRPDAFCIQHHIDIFEGNWPCPDNEMRIPVPLSAHLTKSKSEL